MAAIKFFLGFFCLVVINDVGHTFCHAVKPYGDKDAYRRVVVAAQKEIGVREGEVRNGGERVLTYLRYAGIGKPDKWCAAFVSFAFGQAGYGRPRTAWSPALFPLSRQVGKVAPGMVLGIYYTSLKRIAHCGIVESVKNDWVYSIEGNTNVNGSREGDGVYRRTRHIRSIHRFSDWCKN